MPHALDTIELPRRGRGRPTQAAQERYEDEVDRFCDLINEINSEDSILGSVLVVGAIYLSRMDSVKMNSTEHRT